MPERAHLYGRRSQGRLERGQGVSAAARLRDRVRPLAGPAFVALVLVRVWMVMGIPKVMGYAPHDDLFYAKAAHYIIHRQWMGPYNDMTLIKGPFYSLFIIGSSLAGMPLFLAESLFWLAGCSLLSIALRPLIRERWWRLGIFALLAFAPQSLATTWHLRVYREFVYMSLNLYIAAFSLGLLLRLGSRRWELACWSLGLGLSTGAMLITREDGVWVFPMLILLLAACVALILRSRFRDGWRRVAIVLSAILAWNLPVQAVSAINYGTYGFWGTAELLDPNLNRVLNTLARFPSTTWYPFVSISMESRMAAYRASPMLRQLEGQIEQGVQAWSANDAAGMALKEPWYLQRYTDGGPEIGAHFFWLFRDVVAQQGYYSSGRYPGRFYAALADELERACAAKASECTPPRPLPLIGGIDPRDFPIIARFFSEGIINLLRLDPGMTMTRLDALDVQAWPPYMHEFELFEQFIYNPIPSQHLPDLGSPEDLVSQKTNVSIKMLGVRRAIMQPFVDIYRTLTLPFFVLASLQACALLGFAALGKLQAAKLLHLAVGVYLLGLLSSRLLLLSIVDATTSMAAVRIYSESIYVFIYVFTAVMLHSLFAVGEGQPSALVQLGNHVP